MSNMTNANRLGLLLHPARQNMVITDVAVFNDTTKMYTLKSADNKELAYYEAGCYIPVFVNIAGNVIERPYGLTSSPKEAEHGIYKIVVKETVGGYVSTYIIEHWKAGDHVVLGSPKASEVYSPIRDSRNVIALAGGVGITPFRSMAWAVADGDNDYNLSLFYGANTVSELLFADEWKEIMEKSGGKVKVIPVIAKEEAKGCERGFITLDMIKKYVNPADATFFISGPPAMMAAMDRALAPLKLPKRRVRISYNGDGGFRKPELKDSYELKLHMGGETYTVQALAGETILVAIEKAGLRPAVQCRSGVCGFCRSMLISGEYELADCEVGIRKGDQKFGFIHPCCSYPRGDMEIVVQRAK